jgi:hypothetical protein
MTLRAKSARLKMAPRGVTFRPSGVTFRPPRGDTAVSPEPLTVIENRPVNRHVTDGISDTVRTTDRRSNEH